MNSFVAKIKYNIRAKIAATVCICIALLALGAIIGVLISRNKGEPSVDTGGVGEPCVLPYTLVRVIRNYSCNHTEIYETDDYIGYTQSMLEELTNCRIDTMTDEYVCLVFDTDECCAKHFMLILVDEDVLCVFSTNSKEDGNEQLMEIPVDTSLMDETEHKELAEGIVFDSLEEINAYVENIET